MAEISIIIVNWNTQELLEKGLLSIEQLETDLSLEVLVVDNGSTDQSAFVVKEKFPKVRLIQNEKNLGFAKAVNQGLKQSQGEFVLLLNSDAQLLPGTLERLKEVLTSKEKIAMVGAELIYEDGSSQNALDHFPNLATELLNKSVLKLLFPKIYPGKRSKFELPTEVPSLIGAGVMLKKKAIDDVGLLDEDYFFFLEETDWCYQMEQKGWMRLFVPGAKVIHLQGQTAKKYAWRSKIEFYRSRYHFFKKNQGLLLELLLMIGLILKIMIGFLFSGLATFLTLGLLHSVRKRFVLYAVLFAWHLLGCPKKMGLSVL